MTDPLMDVLSQNLEYKWGTKPPGGCTDCFGLVTYYRELHGRPTPDFSWVYRFYTEETLDNQLIHQWINNVGKPTLHPRNLDIAVIGDTQPLLGTVVTGDRILLVAHNKKVLCVKSSAIAKTCPVKFYYLMKLNSAERLASPLTNMQNSLPTKTH